jgi:N-methylhydantoinase A/oxoprolinase/acetone carboxylase beta subunit
MRLIYLPRKLELKRFVIAVSDFKDSVAYGFIKVANESMCRPIRAITLSKGIDTSNHILCSFGGAGITVINAKK